MTALLGYGAVSMHDVVTTIYQDDVEHCYRRVTPEFFPLTNPSD